MLILLTDYGDFQEEFHFFPNTEEKKNQMPHDQIKSHCILFETISFLVHFHIWKICLTPRCKNLEMVLFLLLFGSSILSSVLPLQLSSVLPLQFSFSIPFKNKLNFSSHYHVNVYLNNTTTTFFTFSLSPTFNLLFIAPMLISKLNSYFVTPCIWKDGITSTAIHTINLSWNPLSVIC